MVLGGRWGLWLAGGEGGLECLPEARQWSWGDLFLLTAFFFLSFSSLSYSAGMGFGGAYLLGVCGG